MVEQLPRRQFFGFTEPAASARSDPREEVLLRYTTGTGHFSQDKHFITLKMQMFRPDGTPDGHHEGVWEALFTDPVQLLMRPSSPVGAFNIPRGPVPSVSLVAQTKGIWAFGDGSSITAIGPALSHLVPLRDGSFLFMVCCAQTICAGEGRYEGARGLKTSMGSTLVAKGTNLFGPDDITFQAKTIDTFRVATNRHLR